MLLPLPLRLLKLRLCMQLAPKVTRATSLLILLPRLL